MALCLGYLAVIRRTFHQLLSHCSPAMLRCCCCWPPVTSAALPPVSLTTASLHRLHSAPSPSSAACFPEHVSRHLVTLAYDITRIQHKVLFTQLYLCQTHNHYHHLHIYPSSGAKYCDRCVCVSLCLSLQSYISKTTRPNFIKFPVNYLWSAQSFDEGRPAAA